MMEPYFLAARRQPRLSKEGYLQACMQHRFCLVSPGDTLTTNNVGESVAVAAGGGCIPILVLPDSPFNGAAFRGELPNMTVGARRPLDVRPPKGHHKKEDPALLAAWMALPRSMRAEVPYGRWAWMHEAMQVMLPYARWLDWCQLGFIVPTSLAVSRMQPIMAHLATIGEEALQAKVDGARRVRGAFVVDAAQSRNGSPKHRLATAEDFMLAEMCNTARAAQQIPKTRRSDESSLLATRLSSCLVLPLPDTQN